MQLFFILFLVSYFQLIFGWVFPNFNLISRPSTTKLLAEEEFAHSLVITGEPVIFFQPSSKPDLEADKYPIIGEKPIILQNETVFPHYSGVIETSDKKQKAIFRNICNDDKLFGITYADPDDGRISKIGTLCMVKKHNDFNDDLYQIEYEAIKRFNVKKLVRTLPYLVAEIANIKDDPVPEDQEEYVRNLEREIYGYLKYYTRILRAEPNNKQNIVEPFLRPLAPNYKAEKRNHDRSIEFSFGMMQIFDIHPNEVAQACLQSTNLINRLEFIQFCMKKASESASDDLIEAGYLTEETSRLIFNEAMTNSNDDDIYEIEQSE